MVDASGRLHRLRRLLAPRSIAFVGASARPNTPGNDMLHTIRRGGYRGIVHAVNPGGRPVEGYPCVPAIADLPAPPDLAVLSVRNERLEQAMAEAVAVGAGAAVIFASAFLMQDRDPPLQARLAAMASAADMPVCGGNCMGFYNDLDQVWVCGFPSPRLPNPGSIALIAHSGSVFGALAHNDPRLRFALVISPGQELTTTVADYIDYALERSEVKVIGLFIETARDPAGFLRALAKATARNIPVVALKVGRTEAAAAAAMTHSGAIAGSDAAYEAVFDRSGVIRVETLDELAATLLMLSTGRQAAAGGLVSIHDSGGEREMIIDLAERAGVSFAELGSASQARLASRLEPGLLAENPLDAWGTGRDFQELFTDCFAALVEDNNAAIGLFCTDLRDRSYVSEGFAAAAAAVARFTQKPVAVATNYTQVRHDMLVTQLSAAGVPVLDGTANALAAVRGALAWRDVMLRRPDHPPALQVRPGWLPRLAAGLDEAAALELLDEAGIPVVRHAVAESAEEVIAQAARLGFPVVVKSAIPGLLHKSDRAGVHLGLTDAAAVGRAWDDLAGRLGPRVTVAAMIPRGLEIALGMVRDPQFGPIVVVSAGGTLIEFLRDSASALAPFGPATAARMLDRIAVSRLFAGARGFAPVDPEALAMIIARFSVLAAELGDRVTEIDVNPLICGTSIVAVDAVVVSAAKDASAWT